MYDLAVMQKLFISTFKIENILFISIYNEIIRIIKKNICNVFSKLFLFIYLFIYFVVIFFLVT